MLRLRDLGQLDLEVKSVTGQTLEQSLVWWEKSARRHALRELLHERDGVDPAEVIMTPARAAERGLTSTVCFPRGNVAPEGSVIKSTAIDPRVIDPDGVYRKTGPAKVFVRERDAIAAIKGNSNRQVVPGDVLVLAGRGPMGSGMEEIFQITSALRYLSWGHEVAVVTDARFSGVSTGACIGQVGPEGLAGGPIGKLRDGDRIRIVIDCKKLTGAVDLVGDSSGQFDPEQGARVLAGRSLHPQLSRDPQLPPETRLWAALQQVGGGHWGGCVFDVERIVELLEAGQESLDKLSR
jgi:dihydroxyacid dehydratase/phosphogluconate dehydratase